MTPAHSCSNLPLIYHRPLNLAQGAANATSGTNATTVAVKCSDICGAVVGDMAKVRKIVK